MTPANVVRSIQVVSTSQQTDRSRKMLIKEASKEKGKTFFVAVLNNKEVQVFIGEVIHVVCKNASHKAWGNVGGHCCKTINEALEKYKSSEAKQIIKAAFDFSIA